MNEAETDNPYLVDELLIVRHSGEIPEVALHGSLYYLTQDPEGPGLVLDPREIKALKSMVMERYREIIRRDLDPANRDKPLYRGLARAAVNWRRLVRFCRNEGLAVDGQRTVIGRDFLDFVRREAAEVAAGLRLSSINCSIAELRVLTTDLGLDPDNLPAAWEKLCSNRKTEFGSKITE